MKRHIAFFYEPHIIFPFTNFLPIYSVTTNQLWTVNNLVYCATKYYRTEPEIETLTTNSLIVWFIHSDLWDIVNFKWNGKLLLLRTEYWNWKFFGIISAQIVQQPVLRCRKCDVRFKCFFQCSCKKCNTLYVHKNNSSGITIWKLLAASLAFYTLLKWISLKCHFVRWFRLCCSLHVSNV